MIMVKKQDKKVKIEDYLNNNVSENKVDLQKLFTKL